LNPRAGRLLERLPRPTVYSAVELALLVLIAAQLARLFWILVAPLGPVGEWRAASAMTPPANVTALGSFDPFFRLAQGGPVVVTALNLTLHGIREDRATGRGSAIIALPDGRQLSFLVGEEIMPGVSLAAVGFDNVTISRAGTPEQLFLDQSGPAQTVAVAGQPTPMPTGAPVMVAPSPVAGAPLNLQPRLVNGAVTGIIVGPGTNPQIFQAAGFAPGDVIVSISGQPVTSLDQARALAVQSGGEVNVMVDRGGRAVPLRVRLNP
jgi:general secretion pathway protein C